MDNWPDIIKRLNSHGRADSDIARALGVSRQAVHQIKNGITVTPKYGIGAGLKEMLETLDRQARRLAAKKGREK